MFLADERLAFPATGFFGERCELSNGCILVGQWQDPPVEATQHLVLLKAVCEHIEERGVLGSSVFRHALSLAEEAEPVHQGPVGAKPGHLVEAA